MSRKSLLALSRRMFLVASGIAAGALALPDGVLAAEPEHSAVSAVVFDGDALLAGGADLSRSDDGGQSWTELPAPGPILTLDTHPERPGLVLAGLVSGGVALSEDGGRNWESRSDGLPEGEVNAATVASGQPDMFYAAVRDDGLWRSEDAGQSWSFAMDRPWLEETEHDLLTLASVDLATGMGGIWIYAGTEAGLTRVPDCFCRWQDVQPGDAMDALVSGDAPPSEAPLPAGEAVHALASAPSAPETLYSALPSGIWTSRDGGIVWSHLVEGPASAVAVHPADAMQVVAVLDGTLQISRDGGATWAALAAE